MSVFALKYSREIMQPQQQQKRGLEKTKNDKIWLLGWGMVTRRYLILSTMCMLAISKIKLED